MTKWLGVTVLALIATVIVSIALTFTTGGPSTVLTTVGRHAPPVYERNCPHPSPGQWCPYVDDGQVQPQPVWP